MAKAASPIAHPWLRPLLSRTNGYRRQVRAHARHVRLDRCLRGMLEALPDGPSEEALVELWQIWGDNLPASRVPYIRTSIAEAARAAGPILQCGSSLSSILIGALCHQAQARAKHLWILEHDPHWGGVIRSWLEQYEISKAHVISAPAEQFDGFVWYVLDTSRLPDNFDLVLCDGSAALPSSARGVMERISDRLDHRCVILARNARRPRDLKHLADWAKSVKAPFIIQDATEPYAKIALRDQRADSDHTEDRLNTVYNQ